MSFMRTTAFYQAIVSLQFTFLLHAKKQYTVSRSHRAANGALSDVLLNLPFFLGG